MTIPQSVVESIYNKYKLGTKVTRNNLTLENNIAKKLRTKG